MRARSEKGFTVLEALVVLIVGGILIGTTVSLYQKFMNIHRRQERVILVERELSSIQLSLGQALTTMPGRELSYYSGTDFTIAVLPALDSSNGEQLIQLGVVTPFK